MIRAEVSKADLNRIEARVKYWRNRVFGDLLRRVGDRVSKQTRHRITREKSSPDGAAWPPRLDDEPHPLLDKSGKLIDAIRAVRQTTDEIHVAPFGVLYAAVQQFGKKDGTMPAREYMGLSSENISDITTLINSWVASRGT